MKQYLFIFTIFLCSLFCSPPSALAAASVSDMTTMVTQLTALQSTMNKIAGEDAAEKEDLTENLQQLKELKTQLSTLQTLNTGVSTLSAIKNKITSLNTTLADYKSLKSTDVGKLTTILKEIAIIKAVAAALF